MCNKRTTFMWLVSTNAKGKPRPLSNGPDILRGIYGDDFTFSSSRLPGDLVQSGLSFEQGVQRLKQCMTLENGREADYLIVEDLSWSFVLGIYEDPAYLDRIITPIRDEIGIVERFETLLPRLATKPFPPEPDDESD